MTMRIFFDDDSNCAMDAVKFKKIRDKCKDLLQEGWTIPALVACIHDLWDRYLCSDKQEEELYALVDPDERYNNVWDYCNRMDYDNPLLEIA